MAIVPTQIAPRRGDLVRVHLLEGEFAYEGICYSSTKRGGQYIVNASSGVRYPPRRQVRIEVVGPAPKRKMSSAQLLKAAASVTWTSGA